MLRLRRIAIALALAALPSLDFSPAASADPPAPAVRSHGWRRHVPAARRAAARSARSRRHAAAPRLATAQAGLLVAWDPETKTFGMPSLEQRLALTADERTAVSRSFDGLVPIRHADGSVSVDLQGRFQEFAVVHLGPDGKPVYRCLDDSAAVRRALVQPARPGLEER